MPMSSVNRGTITPSRPSMLPATRPMIQPTTRPQLSAPRLSAPQLAAPKLQAPALRPTGRTTLPNAVAKPSATRPILPNRSVTNPNALAGSASRPTLGKAATLPANVKRPGNTTPGLNTPRPLSLPGQSTKPATLANQNIKPLSHRDQSTKPATLPGQIAKQTTLPRQITRPPGQPGQSIKPATLPGQGNRLGGKPDGIRRPGGGSNNWWGSDNAAKPPGAGIGTHRGPGDIDNNFHNNINWSTNRDHWGYNPWWNRSSTRPWYHGCWHYNWNNDYYRHNYWCGYRPWPGYVIYDNGYNDWYTAFGWGLAGWGLGSLIYDSGYLSYYNPYVLEPLVVGDSRITYTEPIPNVAARNAPAAEDVGRMTAKSESYVVDSQAAFKACDYLRALELADKAVAAAPGDGALHEYRALVLFALGKYAEAAGVLNPVLAGGPGWNWATMISLYDSQQPYNSQLQSLERYSKAMPQAADAHFLLGYHYMVGTRLALAHAEFAEAARLQPADSVSAQLRDLTGASSVKGAVDKTDAPKEPAAVAPPPDPVPLEKLPGKWVAERGDKGTVTLVFKHDGKFLWIYDNGDKSTEFSGSYKINDSGMLVLEAEQSQMVASVELPQESQLKFILAGGPPGDPGLTFARK